MVDCDLKAFFDTVDHQKLMARLRQRIADPGAAGAHPQVPESGSDLA